MEEEHRCAGARYMQPRMPDQLRLGEDLRDRHVADPTPDQGSCEGPDIGGIGHDRREAVARDIVPEAQLSTRILHARRGESLQLPHVSTPPVARK